MTQLMLGDLAPAQTWSHIPVEDPRASRIYDRHYSRQTVGADGVLAPGQRFILWHDGNRGGRFGEWFATCSAMCIGGAIRSSVTRAARCHPISFGLPPSRPMRCGLVDTAGFRRSRSRRRLISMRRPDGADAIDRRAIATNAPGGCGIARCLPATAERPRRSIELRVME